MVNRLVSAGWNIIPITMMQNGKKVRKVPAIKSWKNYQKERVPPEVIEKCNKDVAVITGELSNLTVLDIDTKTSYERVRKYIPKTVSVRTPGGGWHIYFTYEPSLKTVAFVDGSGLDIRSEGGYVVAPPSTYPNGKPYEFTFSPEDTPVAKMPDDLLKYILSFKVSEKKLGKTKEELENQWFAEAMAGAKDGNRNQTLIRLIGYFYHYKLPKKNVTEILLNWNSRNQPPIDTEELTGSIRSFYERMANDEEQLLENMNHKHAIVRIGNSVAISELYKAEDGEEDIRFLKQNDFHLLYKNQNIFVDQKPVPLSTIWLSSEDRKEYEGIIFDPALKGSPKFYNLWKGFKRVPKAGEWGLYRKHIEEIIAPQHHKWLLAWMARIVQDPGGERPGTVPVLRSVQGTGKSIFVNIFGEIFGRHFTNLSSIKGLTKQFTHYLKDNILLFLDEGIWGGDKQAAGTLKSIVTEPWRLTEPKGFEAFKIKNHINLIIASNEEWIVPGGMGERRFLVLDISDKRRKDYQYFKKMSKQMYEEGGIEAMLEDLMHLDISGVNLREIPKTLGTHDQVAHGLGLLPSFWYERLDMCCLVDSHDYWKYEVLSDKLYNQYKDYCKERNASRYILNQTHFGRQLRDLCPGMERRRKTIRGERFYVVNVPHLNKCRDSFDEKLGTKNDWNEILERRPPKDEADRYMDTPGSHLAHDD